jgi:hypothetical protein
MRKDVGSVIRHWSSGDRSVRIGRVRAPVRLVAAGVSLTLHFLLGLVLVLLVLQRPQSGRAGNEGIELAVMTDLELQDLQANLADTSQIEVASAALDESTITADVPDPESFSLNAASAPTVLGGAGAAAAGGSDGLDLGALGSGGASFFGVEAVGSRFAYIIDVSGSMTGDRLDAMKRQLLGSVNGLLDHASFCVVLYSSDARALGGGIEWTSATTENKREAALEIRAIDASGGTNPLPAFETVFALDPRPDAIYFMTDGEFADENAVIGRVSIMNGAGRKRTPIHCIAFVSRVSEDVMKRIARVSGGTYTYVPGPGS